MASLFLRLEAVALRSTSRCRWLSVSAHRKLIEVTDEADFRQRVLQASRPVAVDFHAEWCGPCRILGPVLDEVVRGREGRVELAKVDIDQLPELAMQYGVTAVPAVLGFSGGEVKGQFVGAQEKKFVQDFIDTLAR